MDWKKGTLVGPLYIKESHTTIIIDNIKIPGDLIHLELSSIDEFKDHPDQRYLYIITDDLNNYDEDDMVPLIGTFFIKYNNELFDTNLYIKDYIKEEQQDG